MALKINEDCTGCGICVDIAPDTFKIGDDGLAVVIGNGPKAQEAVDSCPVGAISM